ncbi:hypothetical protein KKC13_06915 [bacterium]|nr:hypothetical protein [bacterium]MBU1959259.1 hypothetical protein [bacterium]
MNVTYNLRLKTSILLLSMMMFLLPSLAMAETPKNLAVFYELNGKDAEAKYNKLVEETLPSIGFNLADPHKRVNDQYKTKYGSTTLDLLSFMPVVNDEKVMELFNVDPRLAAFSPFNMLVYKTLKEDTTHVGHLTAEAILEIIGIEDEKVKAEFIASFQPLGELLDKELGTQKSYKTYTKLSEDRMLNFEYEFERSEDMDDFVDEFQNEFEMSFINKEYLIAGFHNFMDTDKGEEILKDYDLFWAYSLCHLGYSYNMFDNEGARPDAGLYAPCTMYMYVKKGSNKLVVGMPKLVNILDTLELKEPSRVALVNKLDKEIPEILTEFGMKAVENVNPLKETPKKELKVDNVKKPEVTELNASTIEIMIPIPPKVPIPIVVKTNGQVNNNHLDRSIKFSKRMPPNYLTSAERYGKDGNGATLSTSTKMIGDVDKGRISAYLRADLMDVKTAGEKLKNAGFEILATEALDKKKTLISIVFTSEDLKTMANKTNRGFMGTLRLLIDPKNKQISITNPLYLAKAFLEQDFNEEASEKVLTAIVNEFTGLRNSMDKLKFQLLPKYQFMNGMPYFKDMQVVARGNDLVAKLQNNKKVVYHFTLTNGSTVVGVRLGKRTQKFPNRIGTNNAGMLPYPLLIENGEAKILDPKYYLALMYPQLTMEEFMTIATIPDAIRKDCTKVFR